MCDVLIVYSNNHEDQHLSLASAYAEALVETLSMSELDVRAFSDYRDYASFHQYMATMRSSRGVVVFYLHGSVCMPGSDKCECECGEPGTNDRCTCITEGRGNVLLSLLSLGAVQNRRLYGATTCYAGVLLGPVTVKHGATCFVGYLDDFQHVVCDCAAGNPFAEVVNSGVLDLARGVSPEDTAKNLRRRYDDWIHRYSDGDEPSGWLWVEVCLRHNARGLTWAA